MPSPASKIKIGKTQPIGLKTLYCKRYFPISWLTLAMDFLIDSKINLLKINAEIKAKRITKNK